jgi:hypothetical protein
MMMDRLNWTPELWRQAQALRKAGKGSTEIADILGLTRRQVMNRFYFKSRSRESLDQKNAVERESRAVKRGTPYRSPYSWPAPSSDAVAERNIRLATPPRDLTAAVCGDPRPGYSALERRGAC